jgi:hypothetical protein
MLNLSCFYLFTLSKITPKPKINFKLFKFISVVGGRFSNFNHRKKLLVDRDHFGGIFAGKPGIQLALVW